MKTNLITQRLSIFVATAIFSLSTLQSAYAAPGNLATAPLFLSNIVEPNLFFTLDDSGSMDYEIVVEDPMPGFNVTNGLPTNVAPPAAGGSRMGYFHPTQTELYNTRGRVPPSHEDSGSTAWDRYWVLRNHNGNKIYYNPATVYTPWPGAKANGDPMFEDANPTAAPDDPVNPDHTVDLTLRYEFDGSGIDVYLPTYYIWDDNNGNGIIEPGDNNTQVEISASDTAAMQNFANWWVYYRSRMNTTKAAIGAVINNTDGTRMGLGLFNGPNSSTSNIGTPKQTALESVNDAAKKRAFLTAFYGVKAPRAGTPGRESMQETGEMFINSGILPANLGGECQQNFNVFMSDGYWSENTSFTSIGNTDRDGTGEFDGGIYADTYSNTLADVAMKYYEEDLKGLADKVPTIPGVDEADHQHMVNFTIAFGVNGSLNPETAVPGTFAWPEPVHATNTTIDDMWHAALNSRGEYLNADSPEELEKSLGRAIAAVAERTATAAAVSINSAKLTTNTIVYLAEFNTNGWQGDLKAFKIKTDAQGNLDPGGELEANPTWRAATELNNRNISADPRVVMTHNGGKGVPFQWDKLSSDQQLDLRTNPSGGLDSDDVGKARLNYLKGSRVDEGTGNRFRERLSLLADLVNSGPVFVGAPDLRWPDKTPFPDAPGKRYSEYKNGPKKTRQEIVYAGANGGFMHGFDANTGREEFAYVANNLFSTNTAEGLHYLTDPNYIHRYYNDLTPTVSDVFDGINWQTVLISGQRGGGRGIYALDVTDPSKFTNTEANAEDVVMWEFTDADDPNLGFTYSRPQVGLGNDGSWVAIFGNGYNGTGDGRGKLFILKIHQGASGWVAGTDYEVISTPPGALYGSPGNRNGLGSPALADIDGNGTIDRAYAGDLFGNMWVFDLSDSADSGNWELAYNTPLFTTIGNEPITAQPTLSRHPTISNDSSNQPNVMVFFGSGQYLVPGDKTSTDDNYFYGVWDKGTASRNRTHLERQNFRSGFEDAAGNPVRVLTKRVVNYAGGEFGWYFKLPDNGERSVTRPVVRGNLVFFNTFVPETAPCNVGGYGFRMAVDIVNGGAPDDPTFDVDGDNDVDDSDQATKGGQVATVAGLRQEGFLPDPVFIENISYTADKPGLVPDLKSIPEGRFSWQELIP